MPHDGLLLPVAVPGAIGQDSSLYRFTEMPYETCKQLYDKRFAEGSATVSAGAAAVRRGVRRRMWGPPPSDAGHAQAAGPSGDSERGIVGGHDELLALLLLPE